LPGSKAALAVSGGGDSIALMRLFLQWVRQESSPLPSVLVVDHGLKDESQAEARTVAAWAAEQGLDAHVLCWTGRKPASNIEERARTARYRLLAGWCEANGISNLFVAHTADDQAETFLLRLARGSGVDGLSAIQPRATLPLPDFHRIQLLRPLLHISRAELRVYLMSVGAAWLDDPMNENQRFARVRIRKALPLLEAAGLPAWRICQAAQHLGRAREALATATQEFLGRHARLERGRAVLDGASLAQIPREIALRALSAVLLNVGGAVYRPRFERLEALLNAILADNLAARTLSGCRIGRAPKAQAAFGHGTLLVNCESERRTVSERSKTAALKRRTIFSSGRGRGSKPSPQKGRIP
jgi:tRNA(Ile)-lysidine synthase